ncbi:MAG: hypothetical protein ACLU4Q_06850 [Streptococcus thermophilus]
MKLFSSAVSKFTVIPDNAPHIDKDISIIWITTGIKPSVKKPISGEWPESKHGYFDLKIKLL